MTLTVTDIPAFGLGWKTAEDVAAGEWGDVFGDAYSIYSLVSGAYTDPIATLIGAGLGVLVSAIPGAKDAIQMVTGDTEDCAAAAEKWEQVGQQLRELGSANGSTMSGLTGWVGDAADASQLAMTDFRDATESVAVLCDNMGRLLRESGTLMDGAYKAVMSILSKAIEWFIATMIAATASAPVTFGGSWAAGIAACQARGAYAAVEVTTTTTRVLNILSKLGRAFSTYQGTIMSVVKTVAVTGVRVGIDSARDGQESVDQSAIDDQLDHP